MRIAVLADAHGNLLALQAVLAALHTVAPDLIVNLGDLATGPFDPAGSADAQMALGCPTVAGNHERNLLEGDDASPRATHEILCRFCIKVMSYPRQWTAMKVTMPRYELHPVMVARMTNSSTQGSL